MKYGKLILVFVLLLVLVGCASHPVASQPPAGIWLDDDYAYQRGKVSETRESLFALDDTVRHNLASYDRMDYTTERRLDHLMSKLYGPTGIRLAYSSGNSTGATQTWLSKRGDCLSLTILAYSAARFLGLKAQMQEVRVPMALDRRDGMDFINDHVNLLIRNQTEIMINGQSIQAGGFVIDFEPQAGSRGTGALLSEDAILARFYNNKGSESLARSDYPQAYAYYKVAIETDPAYVPSYTNLALVYNRGGHHANAERLLLHAMALGGPSYAPLRSLQQLMTALGRLPEAQHYAHQLQRRQDQDPYHWFGVGYAALQDGHFGAAIRALERAAKLSTGFEEVHYNLGLAYFRNGQRDAADKQLTALRAINNKGAGVAVLSRKLSGGDAAAVLF